MNVALKNFLKNSVPKPLIRALYPYALKRRAARLGLRVEVHAGHIDVRRGGDILRLSKAHALYVGDAVAEFDFYFSAVRPLQTAAGRLVDYSSPRYHDVAGFDAYPILFPSLAEPVVTTRQYLGFAGLSEGMVALDLGAYSGLTSILFAQAIGRGGRVVAVEADQDNLECVKVNLANFAKVGACPIELLAGAVWEHNQGIEFSTEGILGASAAAIVGGNRGKVARTPSYTLSAIADKFGLQRVDFIKCDIEGAEKVCFTDQAFFKRFSPRIVIETHFVDNVDTQAKCVADLSALGYRCQRVEQDGFHLPLLQCTRGAD